MVSTYVEGVRSAQAGTTHAWRGFAPGPWQDRIDVRDFLQRCYTPYRADASFLSGPTDRTTRLWSTLTAMFPEERAKGVYDVDPTTPAGITAHPPGYIDRDEEIVVGLQTDAPLKRAIMPYGGWRMVETALETYGYPVDPVLDRWHCTRRAGAWRCGPYAVGFRALCHGGGVLDAGGGVAGSECRVGRG